MKQMTPLEELRHSASHVLATAVLRLYPEAQLDIGPPTENGFYYDIDLDKLLTAEDLEALEAEMKKVIKENQRFERLDVASREEALKIIEGFGQTLYKPGRLDDIPEGEPISFYRNGEFIDLCAGTHVNYSKKIKAVKLLSVAGAYHRGDEKNKQLQRIYGTAFPSKDALEQYLKQVEEAKQRDHRKLGREQRLFSIDESVGQGLALWHPAGAVLRQELQAFITDELTKQGYDQVFTPHIGRLSLFRTSGHFPYYQDSQFPAIVEREELGKMAEGEKSCGELLEQIDEGDVDGFLLRPMNCPMHIKIYDTHPKSYRDLPVRLAEFGAVYRWEQSGELNGMTRVRGFTQDDAHIFCTEEQLGDELKGCLSLVNTVFNTLGMKDYRVRVGLRDPDKSKFVGDSEKWDIAEDAVRAAVKSLGVPYAEEPGEAAFYGPKIDFVVKDVIGREWQLGTVQCDYVLPERFNLSYIGPDNKEHRPVMIHRAPFGSLERFCGVLIEHFAGNFPLWLAPEQVRVLPISDKVNDYAKEVHQALRSQKFRATLDTHGEKLGAKIRRAETEKVPVMLILGEKEAEQKQVSIRSRTHKSLDGSVSLEDAIQQFSKLIESKALPETA